MPTLKVTRTGNRFAFDVIEGAPRFQVRHAATAVKVRYHGVEGIGRIRTYANIVGYVTIRHKIEISENIIDRFHLRDGQVLRCSLEILGDGSHLYTIEGNPE